MYIAKSFRSNGFPITIECRKVPRMSVESKEWHKPAQSCLKSLTQGLQGDLRAGSIASGLKMNISFLAPVITLLGCQVLEDNSSGWMTHGKPFASGSFLQGKLDDYTEWLHWVTTLSDYTGQHVPCLCWRMFSFLASLNFILLSPVDSGRAFPHRFL
jgi:hypothetical protein